MLSASHPPLAFATVNKKKVLFYATHAQQMKITVLMRKHDEHHVNYYKIMTSLRLLKT
jgi:hypothetical protein